MIGLASALAASLITGIQSDSAPDERSTPLNINIYGLYTVDVNVGRQVLFSGDPHAEPIPFIVDTGASHTAVPRLIAQQLADQEQISLDLIGHGMTGQFDTDLLFVDQLDFGLGAREVEVAVFEEAFGSVMSAAGLLGANAFPDNAVQLDFPGLRLRQLPAPFTDGSPDLRVENGLILGEASIRGVSQPVHVLVDTGASASIVNSALVDARGGSVRISNTVVSDITSQDTPGEVRKMFSRFQLDNLCIGLFEITVSDVYAFDNHGWTDQPAIILGMDVLKDAIITIDHRTGHVAIEGLDVRACS